MSDDHDLWRPRVLAFDSTPTAQLEPVLAHLAVCPSCRELREAQLAAKREGRPFPPAEPTAATPVPAAEPAPVEEPPARAPRAERAADDPRTAREASSSRDSHEHRRPADVPAPGAPARPASRSLDRPAPEPAQASDSGANRRPSRPIEAPALDVTPRFDAPAAPTPVAAAPEPVEPAAPGASSGPVVVRLAGQPAGTPASIPAPPPPPRMLTQPAPSRPSRRRARQADEWEPLRRLVMLVVLPVIAVIALVAWLRVAAGPPPPPPETATPTGFAPTARPGRGPDRAVAPTPAFGALDLRLERYSGAPASDGAWHTGDPFDLRFTLPSASHVVAWRVRPSGDVVRVYPPAGAVAAVRHGTGEVVLPPITSRENWAFDETAGPETFVVAVSEQAPAPLASLDDAVATALVDVTDRVARLELLDTVLREHFGPASRLDVEHLP